MMSGEGDPVTRLLGRVGAVVAAVLMASAVQGVAHADGTVSPDSDYLPHVVSPDHHFIGFGAAPAVLSPYRGGVAPS